MKRPVIAVYDRKIALFELPNVFRHNGEALREFTTLKTKPDTKFGANPEDYDLYQIALFDDETGQFENVTPHVGLT